MRKRHGRPRSRQEDIIIMDVGKLKDGTVDCIQLQGISVPKHGND
jgi:hypothetical protein